MTIAFKKRKRPGRATQQTLVETEVARLLLLSLPAGRPARPTNAKK